MRQLPAKNQKPVKKQTPAKKQKPVQEPPPAAPRKAHTLESLAKTLGPPDVVLREAWFEDIDEATLVEKGIEVDSDKIIKDMPVFIGMAFDIERALSDAQRERLFLRPEVLPILAAESLALKELKATHDADLIDGAGGKAEREAEARREMQGGILLRDAIYDALRNALGQRGTVKLDEVFGTAETGEALAKGMKAMAGFIRERLKKGKKSQKLRLATFCIDHAKAQALDDKAASVTKTSARTAGSGRRVSQRALDRKDGEVLTLVEQVLRAYRAAHRQDASILVPELRTIGRLFDTNASRKAKKSKVAKPKGGKPTGGKPTGDKPTGDKPTGDKPTGDKPTGGEQGG